MTVPLDDLVAEIRASAKYRDVSEVLIREAAAREMHGRMSAKEAEKAIRSKMHQVAGAYRDGRPAYDAWLKDLAAAPHPEAQRAVCLSIMKHHASSRERLPYLEAIYGAVFERTGPVRSVLDVACGLNPLAIPWMNLAQGATYTALDIYEEMTEFLNACLPLFGVVADARTMSVVQGAPTQRADMALVLKCLPCLEQLDKGAPLRLLRSLNVRHALVTFPAKSLGGKNRNMPANYSDRFLELIKGEPWSVESFSAPTEVCFLLTRTESGANAERPTHPAP